MPTTKEHQRNELHKTIWSIADDLRGSVDSWDFKSYILGMLFYRLISENLCAYLAEQEGDPSFDYARIADGQAEYGREETVKEKGFFILPSELFSRVLETVDKDGMAAEEGGDDLNEILVRVFANIDRIARAVVGRTEEDSFSVLVPNDQVLANDANLSVSSYVEKPDDREEVDIDALNAEISRIVAHEQELREAIDEIIADLEGGAR